jgi:hypothetical protein
MQRYVTIASTHIHGKLVRFVGDDARYHQTLADSKMDGFRLERQ